MTSITIPTTITVTIQLIGIILALPMSYASYKLETSEMKAPERICITMLLIVIASSVIAVLNTLTKQPARFDSLFISASPWSYALAFGYRFWARKKCPEEKET